MKFNKFFSIIACSLLLFSNNTFAFAKIKTEQKANEKTAVYKQEEKTIDLNLDSSEKHIIKINDPVKKIDGQLYEQDQDSIQKAFEIQKKQDTEDIRLLWESTVERNSVIKFALKKIAMPPEQRKMHSSLMARSISALISGASILPSFFGADSIAASASMASGSLANRIIRAKTLPNEMPLTDTELIQLAGLIEELQNKLIKSYYDYKSAMESLRSCRQQLLVANRNYNEALKSKDSTSIIVTSAMYDKQRMEEIKLVQKAKIHRLELERLAGSEAVSNLALTTVAQNIPVNNYILQENSSNNTNNEKLSTREGLK